MKKPVIFFDLGNVIVLFERERAVRNLQPFCDEPPESIRDLLLEPSFQKRYETGQVSSREVYEQFCRDAKCRANFDQFMIGVSDIFKLNPFILPLLSNVKAAGYHLGLLSNTNDAHWRFLTRRIRILTEFFETQILSYQVHAMKPDAAIYQEAEKQAGVAGADILFMDDREENVAAALEQGWHATRFQSPRQLASFFESHGVVCNG